MEKNNPISIWFIFNSAGKFVAHSDQPPNLEDLATRGETARVHTATEADEFIKGMQSGCILFQAGLTPPRPSEHHEWDGKSWVIKNKAAALNNAKAEKLKKANAMAQEFINEKSGANLIPAFELATWGLQAAEAMAWEENKKADTPILNGIAAARGVDENVLKAAALKKAKQYSKLTAHVAGERQAIQDRIQAAKTIEDLDGIVIGYTLPEEK